jgi:ABC-type Zn uptake system ZnuABC Zn-binding protein ZnuA
MRKLLILKGILFSILILTGGYFFIHEKEKAVEIDLLFTLPFLADYYRPVFENFHVESLLSSHQDPHHVHLSPAKREMIEKSKILILVHPEYETWLPKDLSTHQVVLWSGVGDRHFWVSPEKMKQVTLTLLSTLEAHPLFAKSVSKIRERAHVVIERANSFSSRYHELSERPLLVGTLHQSLDSLKNAELSFLKEFALDKGHHHHHGSHHSPKHLEHFFNELNEHDVQCLLGVGETPKQIQSISQDQGVPFLGELMVDHLEQIEDAWQNNFDLLKQCQN